MNEWYELNYEWMNERMVTQFIEVLTDVFCLKPELVISTILSKTLKHTIYDYIIYSNVYYKFTLRFLEILSDGTLQ